MLKCLSLRDVCGLLLDVVDCCFWIKDGIDGFRCACCIRELICFVIRDSLSSFKVITSTEDERARFGWCFNGVNGG